MKSLCLFFYSCTQFYRVYVDMESKRFGGNLLLAWPVAFTYSLFHLLVLSYMYLYPFLSLGA